MNNAINEDNHQIIEISHLDFDPLNPRLPEWVKKDEDSIFHHIMEYYAIDELIDSFLDNGYFEAERLIVIPSDTHQDHYTVLEGNRRLAALKYLHQESSLALDPAFVIPSDKFHQLTYIPCLIIGNREDVNTYLAYRHIGGMKTWGAEAKARFILRMTRKLVANGDPDPFKTVGKRVGSNAAGIRNLYAAIAILEYAKEELRHDISYVQYNRFGVWTRCMNSSEIKDYICFGNPKEYEEVTNSLKTIDSFRLKEVVDDLTVRSDGRAAIVNDSRLVTSYGRVLANERARLVLRDHENLQLAIQVLSRQDFSERISSLANQVSILLDEISIEELDAATATEAYKRARKLFGSARLLSLTLSDVIEDDDRL